METSYHPRSDLITHYAEETSKWVSWQVEYRFGAFYVFPPEPLRKHVNELRSTHDAKAQAYCDAHISLTVPLPRAISAKDWDCTEEALLGVAPFRVNYGPLTSYKGVAGVVIKIEPARDFNRLVTALESTSVFKDAKPRNHPFSPHMTVAEFISLEDTPRLLEKLSGENLRGEYLCDTISYAVPDNDFHFSERAFIKLKS